MKTICPAVVVLAATLGAAAPASAQAGTQTESGVSGENVVVKRFGGAADLRGRFERLDKEKVSILVRGQRIEVPLAEVYRVDVGGDSVKNGAIIGGAVLATWCALICGQGLSNNDAGTMIVGMSIVALEGAGIGALIDHAISRKRTIYVAPPRTFGQTHPDRGVVVGVGFRF